VTATPTPDEPPPDATPTSRARAFGVALLAFVPMAAIGTVVHELGHFAAGLALGSAPRLHYGSVSYAGSATDAGSVALTAAGPLSNVAVGTVGAALLWRRRRERRDEPLDARDGVLFALALFWSRQVAIALAALVGVPIDGGSNPSDEVKLAAAASLPEATVALASGALGLAACLLAIALLPRRTRLATATGAALGSLAGFPLWHAWLGPLLLP
jgi:hypothetical protein